MSKIIFLTPRFTGTRFEEHAIPLEFLKDLAVLEEMIIEVAKWKFLQEHPERKRVPRGFTKGIELKMTDVENGSAKPIIALFIAAATFLPVNQTYFEQARDGLVNAIAAAEQNTSITAHLPEKALGYFDPLGRSLREGEALEFIVPSQPMPARLTKETRRKLVLASASVKEITEETTIRGMIPEADQDNMTFEILMADGRKARAPMTAQHRETIIEAFTGYKDGIRVSLQGIGSFSRLGKLQRLESVEQIGLLDPLDVQARLDELRGLRDGWLEGEGIAPKEIGLDWFAQTFEHNFPDDLPLPHIYPTAEGGVQAEWSLKPNEVSLEIDFEQYTGEWHALNLLSAEEEARTLNLNDQQDWKWIADQIRNLGGVA